MNWLSSSAEGVGDGFANKGFAICMPTSAPLHAARQGREAACKKARRSKDPGLSFLPTFSAVGKLSASKGRAAVFRATDQGLRTKDDFRIISPPAQSASGRKSPGGARRRQRSRYRP